MERLLFLPRQSVETNTHTHRMSVEELTPYVERLSFGGKAIATEIVECVLSRVAEWNATWRVELAMFDGVLSSEDPLGSNGLDRKFALSTAEIVLCGSP